MIEYSGPFSFFRWRGSVAPKALMWAVPCSCLVFVYDWLLRTMWPDWDKVLQQPSNAESAAIGLFTSILGFLIVFRANLAYGRFWEGITLVERACSVWLNGVSNLIAFCNSGVEKQVEVAAFQHLLTRLMSLLLSISLSDVSCMPLGTFPNLDLEGIDPECLEYLKRTQSKQKVVLQWVQRLVIEKERDGVLDVSAPILSRVFQEFSIGIVNFIEARKLTSVPFPFIFAQLVHIVLVVFSTLLMPLTCAFYVPLHKAVALTLLVVFAFMSIHYISVEIEQPFGGDLNDLPLADINFGFNQELMTLLEEEAQQTPSLIKSTGEIKDHVSTCRRIAHGRMSVSQTSILWDSAESEELKSEKKNRNSGYGSLMSVLPWSRIKSSFAFASRSMQLDEEQPAAMGIVQQAASDVPSYDRLSRTSYPSPMASLSEHSSTCIAQSFPTLPVQPQDECSDAELRCASLDKDQRPAQKQWGMLLTVPRQTQEPEHQRRSRQVSGEWQGRQRSPPPSPQHVPSTSALGSSDEVADCHAGEDVGLSSRVCAGSGWMHNLATVTGTQPPLFQGDLDSAEHVGLGVGGGRQTSAGSSSTFYGFGGDSRGLTLPTLPTPEPLNSEHV